MLDINFHPFPILTTERLVLRQMNNDDANEVFFLRSDDEMLKYVGRPKAQSMEEILKWIEMVNDNIVKNEGINWAITLENETKLIGIISFWRIDKQHHRAEVGYVLHPGHQKKGIMDEALKVILHYGFHTLKFHSVEANIDPENTASKFLLERNGFIREAYYKENYFFDGKFWDSAIYSLLTPVK
jgi:ribosomal-protein-alanine N-acetyltransferase